MAEQTFNIEFNGYWRIGSITDLPSKSGIYCVYDCTYNKEANTVTLLNLFYIDDVDNANEEIKAHKNLSDWKKRAVNGNEICFSFATVDSMDKLRVKAALINNKKPALNTEYKDYFPFDRTTINASGRTALLNTFFTIERKDAS